MSLSRGRSRSVAERGAVTAEFVIVLPGVILLFVLLTSAIATQLQLSRLSEAAAWAAREAAWGHGIVSSPAGITLQSAATAEETCVTARLRNQPTWLAALNLEEKVCLPNRGY